MGNRWYKVKKEEFNKARAKAGLSFSQLAKASGLSKSTLVNFAHGRTLLSQDDVGRLLQVRGFDVFTWGEEAEEGRTRRRAKVSACFLKPRRFLDLMAAQGYSNLRSIAKKAGVSATSISYWLRGYGATLMKAYQLAQAFGVELEDLWDVASIDE